MTKDEILSTAKEFYISQTNRDKGIDIASLERFAALVAEKEREACAELCSDMDGGENMFSRAIRSRGSK